MAARRRTGLLSFIATFTASASARSVLAAGQGLQGGGADLGIELGVLDHRGQAGGVADAQLVHDVGRGDADLVGGVLGDLADDRAWPRRGRRPGRAAAAAATGWSRGRGPTASPTRPGPSALRPGAAAGASFAGGEGRQSLGGFGGAESVVGVDRAPLNPDAQGRRSPWGRRCRSPSRRSLRWPLPIGRLVQQGRQLRQGRLDRQVVDRAGGFQHHRAVGVVQELRHLGALAAGAGPGQPPGGPKATASLAAATRAVSSFSLARASTQPKRRVASLSAFSFTTSKIGRRRRTCRRSCPAPWRRSSASADRRRPSI